MISSSNDNNTPTHVTTATAPTKKPLTTPTTTPNFFVHPTAIVDTPTSVGNNTKIWHFTHVCSNSSIGENCVLGQNVFIANDVSIGNGCKIQNNVSVYKGVHVEDDVFLGPSCVFTNDMFPRAQPIGGHWDITETRLKKGASIGANATIRCGVTLGQYSMVGAGSVVTKDLKDFSLVIGVPAKQIGWVSKAGRRLDFDANGMATCPVTNERYMLKDDLVSVV